MKLVEYFALPDAKSQAQLAEEIGKSPSYVSRVKSGSLTPSIRAAHRIQLASGGKVTLADLVPVENTEC